MTKKKLREWWQRKISANKKGPATVYTAEEFIKKINEPVNDKRKNHHRYYSKV